MPFSPQVWKTPKRKVSLRDMRTILENQNCVRDAAAKCFVWVRGNFWVFITLSRKGWFFFSINIILGEGISISTLYWERITVVPNMNYQPYSPWTQAQYSCLLFILRIWNKIWSVEGCLKIQVPPSLQAHSWTRQEAAAAPWLVRDPAFVSAEVVSPYYVRTAVKVVATLSA